MADDLAVVEIDRDDIESALRHLYAIGVSLGAGGGVDALVQDELRGAVAWLTDSEARPMAVLAVAGFLMAAFEQIAQDCVEGIAPLQFTDAAFDILRIRLLN
jgi:hypothetical protein